ncbi:MAG TPA: hypothetical protein PKL65_04390 [Bacteroidales bacterium]|nr:hypothetical protein [Bacteroidales bacterium]HPM17797.1 hypothetical protein [Bacteroidales bacterium]
MKKTEFSGKSLILIMIVGMITAAGCGTAGSNKKTDMTREYTKGTYGYDKIFLEKNNISTIELTDPISGSRVLLAPGLQGRVMTSSADGDSGLSFGWINYKLIESGEQNTQFNPFGGEERFWLGPEGGPFSIYFRKGDEQVYSNWKVPDVIDTQPFEIVSAGKDKTEFSQNFTVTNSTGTSLDVGVERTVKLLSGTEIMSALNVSLDGSVKYVGYESVNRITNNGTEAWTEKSGFLSIWMLSMFTPSSSGIVFIPFKPGSTAAMGKIVSDDYFGTVPPDRLVVRDDKIFFSIDGKFRSKIGISPERALPFAGSYDPDGKTLTILWFSLPGTPGPYVNSKWGNQDNPLKGDAVNSYNDGPVEDGSIMGPFYEIESSSPAAFLKPGEKMTHVQRIFHFTGSENELNRITEKIFSLKLEQITASLKK